MLVLLVGGFALAWWAETRPNPVMGGIGPLMEGKETALRRDEQRALGHGHDRTSNGAVNSMHDSFTPLAGLVPLWNLMLGCIVFGGVGAGLYGILMHVLITVFIAGLMIGRTPEYLGKKIQAWEATWAIVAILVPSLLILAARRWRAACRPVLPAWATRPARPERDSLRLRLERGQQWQRLRRPEREHHFYNLTLGVAMFLGRFGRHCRRAGDCGRPRLQEDGAGLAGTLPTNGLTFACVLFGVIIIVAALTFFPALCLGPIVEHGLMLAGRIF